MSPAVEVSHLPQLVPMETVRAGVAAKTRKAQGDQRPARKRARNTADDGEENEAGDKLDDSTKRSRGRPRLNTQDETAVDRRRTQIRLAQRAYRNRKDAAISSLEQKVKNLQDANTSMTNAFAGFYNFALAGGLLNVNPEAANRLKDLMNTFDRFGSRSSEEEDLSSQSGSSDPAVDAVFDDASHQPSTSSSSTVQLSPKSLQPTAAAPKDAPLDVLHSAHEAPLDFDTVPYEVIAQPTPENASYPFYSNTQLGLQEQPFGSILGPGFLESLPPPMSYGAHEGCFSRRLHRVTNESGLRLAAMSSPPPDQYAAVFGFCLLFESRDRIIDRLRTSLRAAANEGLNHWRAPFTNLGGSGMFPTDGMSGISNAGSGLDGTSLDMSQNQQRELFQPQDMNGFSMGPFDPQTRLVADDLLDSRMNMLLPGFQGSFMDPSEVERYFSVRGIVIPPRADFVDVEIDFNQFQDEVDDGQGSVPRLSNAGQVTGTGSSMGDWGSDGMSWGSGAGFAYCPMLSDPRWPQGTTPNRRRVTINVEVLVDEMIGKAVCLGRSPGYRQKHVNKALKISIGALSRTKYQDRHKG